MFSSQTDLEPPPAARRLRGLGLIPDPPGWVPEQPAPTPGPASLPEPAAEVPRPAQQPMPTVGDAMRAALAERLPPSAGGLVERVTVTGLLWTLAILVAAIVAAVVYLHKHNGGAASPYASASTYSSGTSSSTDSSSTDSSSYPAAATSPVATSDPASIVVDVGGRVHRPGLVTLPPGARVADAITAAGGPLRPKELARVDLAARVTDGQLLLVGVKGAASSVAATDGSGDPSDPSDPSDSGGSPAPISLSDASLDDLESLPGVGPVTAQKIVDWRTQHGGFTSVSQLQQIPGIGPAHYAEISPLVTP